MSFQKNSASVRIFSILMKFAFWLPAIFQRITPSPFRLIQIGSAFWQSRALYVATCLNIASVIGNGQLTIETIAKQAFAQPDALYRLLRLLAAMGVFEEVSSHVFKNNSLSAYLRDDHPKNVRAMILMHNSMEMSKPWYEQLEQGIQSGEIPFQLSHGQELFSYMDKHAGFDALFSHAMDNVEALTGDSFITDFNWAAFSRIIDVGGSKGSKSLAILKHYPKLNALIFDREQIVNAATNHWVGWQSPSLLSRVSFQAGDMLESVPAAMDDKDIYLLSAILHGFDDENCIKVLRNLVTAIADTGARIAVMEIVMPELKADISSVMCDMQMFMATPGRERTITEWNYLFDQSGLLLEELVAIKSIGKIMVLLKKGVTIQPQIDTDAHG